MSFPYANLESFRPLNRILGKGTFGQVELFEKNNQEFVIKWQEYDSSAIIEISTLRMTDHPNIIKILDLILDGDRIGIVMKFASYGTVLEAIKEQCMNKEEIFYQFLSGLSYLHFLDIQHRDIKPANLLVFNRCQLKIIDFGSAQALRCALPTAPDEDEIVALAYRPPEMLLGGDEFTLASDMWSAGVTIYVILTGRYFAVGKNDQELIQAIAQKLGVPNETSWPKLDSFPNSEFLTKLDYPRKKDLFIDLKPEEQDILNEVLVYNPERRKSAYDLLRKPIFDPYRIKNNEYPLQICLDNLDARRPDFPLEFAYSLKTMLILKTWTFAMIHELKMREETLSYTNQLLDYYLAVSSEIPLHRVQLVAVSAIIIAANLKEIQINLSFKDAAYYTANSYSQEEIFEMRNTILKGLDFDMILSVPHDYITLYQDVYSSEVIDLALEIEKIIIVFSYPYRRDPKAQGLFCLGAAALYLNQEFTLLSKDAIKTMAKNLLKNYPILKAEGEAILATVEFNPQDLLEEILDLLRK